MDNQYNKLKELNQTVRKDSSSKLFYFFMLLITLGFVLLIIDSNKFQGYAVISFFISLILVFIMLFISLIHKAKIRLQMIKNTVDVIYPVVANKYNAQALTEYNIDSADQKIIIFPLYPDYSVNETLVSFTEENKSIEAFQTRIYLAGAEGRNTPLFNGLYLKIAMASTSALYYEKANGFLNQLTNAISNRLFPSDSSLPTQFKTKREFMNGKLSYDSKGEVPEAVIAILKYMELKHPEVSYRLGLTKTELHMALDLFKLFPYVKKYKESEYKAIEDFVQKTCDELSAIANLVMSSN
ncbi:MAG: hypothetical protein KKH01_07970 [Firmicutes bacterium]|nr:hypothetical protein [Bacillota bacterium]